MQIRQLLPFFLFFGALSAVAGETKEAESADDSLRSPSTEGATVSFAMPQDGDLVPLTFEVRFLVSGMGIAPAGSQIANTGHHHLLIDLAELPDMNQPLPATEQIRHFGKGQTETRLTLPEGEHSLQLLFADYQHAPHDPPVISKIITITVSANAPPQEEG
jgi:hypothetical protein